MTNLKLACRRLFKASFVTCVAILSLGWASAPCRDIFLLSSDAASPAPVPAPNQLVKLASPGAKSGSTSCNQSGSCDEIFSYPMFRDLQKAHTVFTDIAAHRLFGLQRLVAGADPNLPIENLKDHGATGAGERLSRPHDQHALGELRHPGDPADGGRLHGVLAFTVAQRTREIGLRMALGAAPRRVRAMVLRQVGIMTLIGSVIGLLAAVWAGAAKAILYEKEGHDPLVLAVSIVLLGAVALAAGFVPAHRASKIAPMLALRYE